jgi:undecaprenyl-diphosphatase
MIVLGCGVSAASAFVVVKWLLGYVRSHRFTGFAIYRILLGGALLLAALLPKG